MKRKGAEARESDQSSEGLGSKERDEEIGKTEVNEQGRG